MFGSLVVALPTKHEGGTFPLRHHGREWVFNSADLVSPKNPKSPRAAFVAFSGDIDHEVTEGQVWLPCYVDLQPLSRG
jgi:hypothetical protein